ATDSAEEPVTNLSADDSKPPPNVADTGSAGSGSEQAAAGGGVASGETGKQELVGRILADRYRILRHLGSGGMGAVYRAEHIHMRKAVAVKVLHREMTYLPEVVLRFEREAVAAARIDHPNVAAATDFGRLEDGSFYLVLEFIEGRSLSSVLRSEKPLPVNRALLITRQIAQALGAAHEVGIVHRDLKPDNVMLIERGDDPDFVKVLDFGIAKVHIDDSASQQLTQVGSVFGTPEYMAPEQAQGAAQVDARADLYTLGTVLYEMLSGSTPFKDNDLIVVLTRLLTQEPPPLPEGVDREVADLVMGLLRKKPDERPQTAKDVVERIDLLTGVPASSSSARRPSAQFDETVLSLRQPFGVGASAGFASARSALLRTLSGVNRGLRKKVEVAGRRFPIWSVLVLGSVVLFSAGLLIARAPGNGAEGGQLGKGSASRATETKPVVLDSDLQKLVARAAAGERTAIAELEGRPAAERSSTEWKALGRGYFQIQNFKASIACYGSAVRKAPNLADDADLVADVRKMVYRSDTGPDALSLIASAFGSTGADLLFDV
ncbi:MAG TPA: serine/threonine-protein kinase, partial [Polyangiaceae bacterium]